MSVEIITYKSTLNALRKGTEAGIIETCIRVTREAVEQAPVKDGHLKNSIMYKTKMSASSAQGEPELTVTPKFLEGYVGTALDYGTYQEFGTRYMAPQPFLRPAVALVYGADKDDIIDRIRKETARGSLNETKVRETFR